MTHILSPENTASAISNAAQAPKQQFDMTILIGRFQPFHAGHLALLQLALQHAPQVLVVLGSSFAARSTKNPFTWQERAAMIRASVGPAERARIHFLAIRDYYHEQRWSQALQQSVQAHFPQIQNIALVGHFKDNSSRYLSQFPHWTLIAAPRQAAIDATSIRQIYFEAEDIDVSLAVMENLVPLAVRQYLRAWSRLPFYPPLVAEHNMVQKYKAAWSQAPYAPIFSTVDAIVKTAEHVLLIQRAGFPGKGLWALPGGFVEPHERLLPAAMRELLEETRLGILQASLLDAFVSAQVFDHPDRSTRGRTITHAHLFDLKTAQLPEIEGSDDASAARWVPLADLVGMEQEFYEDHFHILDHFFAFSQENAVELLLALNE